MSSRIITVEPRPHWTDLFASAAPDASRAEHLNGKTFRFLGSGKAAVAMILEYLRSTGELPNKMAEVVVPAWISNPVYHQVNWFGFPTLQAGPDAKAIVIYHQYGFPQDLDRLLPLAAERRLIVIEDCAHAPASSYKGASLGSFGRFALYSFSKFTFCYALGGVAHEEPAFEAFIDRRLQRSSRLARRAVNAFKIVDEANLARLEPRWPGGMSTARKAVFGLYGDAHDASPRAVGLWKQKRDAEMTRRRELYRRFRERTASLGLCAHLEADGVTPYVIPIRPDEGRLGAIVDKLADAGFRTGVYHFDFNRCLLAPDFRKTVLIPCHGQLSDHQFERLTDIVVQAASRVS